MTWYAIIMQYVGQLRLPRYIMDYGQISRSDRLDQDPKIIDFGQFWTILEISKLSEIDEIWTILDE